MPAPRNDFKAALAAGELQRGLWLALGSETVTEIAGNAGFDWCLVDGEHAPWEPALIRRQLMVLEGTGTPSIVRVPVNEPWVLKQALDIGAQSVMVPMVNSAEEARAAVAACRYPPAGIRGNGGYTMRASGYGAIPDYAVTANEEICVIVQAESRAAVEALPEIAAVDGVDCVFFGPADLAADMGHRADPMNTDVWDAIRHGAGVIRAAGKAAGLFGPPALEAEMIETGFTMLSAGSDADLVNGLLRRVAGGAA
ncbi:2-keto-3-deoxy-L-rhamnonate aldolase [Rhodobacterales bacterium HKCCSP123]|nr:2-keto-3-deoxy-L-rhamnonate aldolase [Rhodobacterales bacterium HKCCSP123]